MGLVKLVSPKGIEKEFEKTHAERMLCIQFKHNTPKDKSWAIAKGYTFKKTNVDSDCNCGEIVKDVVITKTKTVKKAN